MKKLTVIKEVRFQIIFRRIYKLIIFSFIMSKEMLLKVYVKVTKVSKMTFDVMVAGFVRPYFIHI